MGSKKVSDKARSKHVSKRRKEEVSSSSSSSESGSESDSSSSLSSSESESESDSSESESSSSEPESDSGSDSSASDSSSSDSDSSDSDDDTNDLTNKQKTAKVRRRRFQRQLSGKIATNFDLLAQQRALTEEAEGRLTKDRFKKTYMDYVATGFGDDLDKLRKEEIIGEESLDALVDSLEIGANSFAYAEKKMIADEAALN
ncbi:hypothetical protein EC988_003039 [Linderina pennispora]|nr:hypothetical protein EC988_003039 [Linderina pennispora]